MVQVIENLTKLVGAILARRPHPELDGYDVVTVQIERVEPVEGLPNLLAAQPGSQMDVAMRRVLLGTAPEGTRIQFRAKRTLNGVMCEPHPDPEDFRIA